MIHEVDEALRVVIRRDALNGADVDVVFDAPTKEWAARRNSPAVDVYLYDVREDLGWRAYGSVDVPGKNGTVAGRQKAPKYFKFSYLITAWTQRPEDEHRLLSAVLTCFLRYDALPTDALPAALAAQGVPVRTSIALPPPEDRSLSDVWSALGGELKPSLDLVVLTAIDPRGVVDVAPAVSEPPRFDLRGHEGQSETAARALDGPGGANRRAPTPPGATA